MPVQYRVAKAKHRAGHVPQDHRQRGPGHRPGRRRPARRASRSSTPATRSRRRRDILHQLAELKNFGVRTLQAEDEIAAHRRGHRRQPSAGRIGVTAHQRPGHLPEVRGDRPGRHDRAAAGHHRRAARRPEHRPADQDRAGRPAAGHVRPQRRVPGGRSSPPRSPADCFDMAIEAVRHRHRVHDAGRSSCPTATSPTAPSRGRIPDVDEAAEDQIEHPTHPNSGRNGKARERQRAGKFLPYKRERPAGPPVGRPRARRAWSTASAASRSRT